MLGTLNCGISKGDWAVNLAFKLCSLLEEIVKQVEQVDAFYIIVSCMLEFSMCYCRCLKAKGGWT